jgi:hypothetical protein
MRRELFAHGIITPRDFENQVREQAILSQAREGVQDPYSEEPADVWKERLEFVRNTLTDLHFANNVNFEIFDDLVREALAERGAEDDELLVTFNPELAPQDVLFEQAQAIKNMSPEEYKRYRPRLQEIKVVLIRSMISDQLAYVSIAKDWLKLADLIKIRKHKIGTGRIGGKAAGMLLAYRILCEIGDEDILKHVHIPESYFLAADVLYAFMAGNDLMPWGAQKYKTEEEIRAEYTQIVAEFERGEFPPDIIEGLQKILQKLEGKPLIVRSSSLLEDNFGMSFAGKYESHFCPNQGTPEENLRDLTCAISRVYASAFHPDVLLYRHRRGLQDYDERIAILIQPVVGERQGNYFFPHAAGVAFSRNLFRWSPLIRRTDGFLRIVWGLGTRAVDRVGNDYPRLVALSHPLLHSHDNPYKISNYSQKEIDLIDLERNQFTTKGVEGVIDGKSPILRYIAQQHKDGYLSPLRTNVIQGEETKLVITFDELLRRTPFAERMRRMLCYLEDSYGFPVDMEFTLNVENPRSVNPEVNITILQCRPQSHLEDSDSRLPPHLNTEDIVFSTKGVVPQGRINSIRYVLFISPEEYFRLPTAIERAELARAIGRLNTILADEVFINVGPGRWGTTNPDLGIHVGYSDIYNTRALIELSGKGIGPTPEPSFGTHFFQDLLEAQIYPLAIILDDREVVFERKFFYDMPNRLEEISNRELTRREISKCLRIIDVMDYRPGHLMDLVMDDDKGQAVAFLVSFEEEQ